jgi:translation initiation factor 4E
MLTNQVKSDEYSDLSANKTNGNSSTAVHKLNSRWIFWYASRKEEDRHISYCDRLINIAELNTLEDFFRYYLYIKSVPEIERNTDLGLFKEGYKPLWESCPDGGCWFIRFKKTDDPVDIDNKWEKLLFALVGIKKFFNVKKPKEYFD